MLTSRLSCFLVVVAVAGCSSSTPEGASSSLSSTTASSGTTGSGGGSTTTTSSSIGGGGAPPFGDDNPDNLPETSMAIYSRDYDTEDSGDVTSMPNIALGEWGSSLGHESGGWRFQPDPIDGTTENEHSAGWAWGVAGPNYFPVDGYHLASVSYMYRVSSALIQEIAIGGPFWAHDQKSIDFKYHDPNGPYGEGNRNTIHFGDEGGQVRFSHVDGGGGSRIYFGPDWATLADEWVWICHVIDMRGTTPAERYMATYMKRAGDAAVTRIGIRYEDGEPNLQSYNGRGIWGFLSPIHGYWDDMIGRDSLMNELSQMSVSVDRLRIMPGWPDAANGPPF